MPSTFFHYADLADFKVNLERTPVEAKKTTFRSSRATLEITGTLTARQNTTELLENTKIRLSGKDTDVKQT